jgi:hypothetical protein
MLLPPAPTRRLVRHVEFEPDLVVATAALASAAESAKCTFCTTARYDHRPVAST